MPALFESGVFGNNTPAWHGQGVVVAGSLTTEEALQRGGLDWQVEKRKLYVPSTNGTMEEVPDQFGIVRVTDNKPLGVVGSRYAPIQNRQAFEFVDFLTGPDKLAQWDTAISIHGGATIAGLLALTDSGIEIRKGDKHYHYLSIVTTHDGSGSAKVFPTDVRQVCANTVALALSGRDRNLTVNIRHSGNISAKAADAARVLAAASEHFVQYETWLRSLTDIAMTRTRVDALMDELFPAADPKSERSKTLRTNKVAGLLSAINAEVKLLPQFAGGGASAYEVWNGITRYIDHTVSDRKSDRFAYAVLKGGADFKEDAKAAINKVFEVATN